MTRRTTQLATRGGVMNKSGIMSFSGPAFYWSLKYKYDIGNSTYYESKNSSNSVMPCILKLKIRKTKSFLT